MGTITVQIYFACVAGILISILLPVLKKAIPQPKAGLEEAGPTFWQKLWIEAKPYLAIGAFSLLTALLIVAFFGDSLKDLRAALLAGYAWDSTLQKIAKP